jgi:hypothetical protein
MTFSSTKITNIINQPTGGHSFELRSGLYGLAPLLSKLVLEPLLLCRCRFTDLFELSVKVEDPLFLLGRIPSRSDRPLARSARDCEKMTRSSVTFQPCIFK